MPQARLTPIAGCWVKKKGSNEVGRVVEADLKKDPITCRVQWLQTRQEERVSRQQLVCGFPLGVEVQDAPPSRTRRSLGEGVILETRRIGGREQVLVDFLERGERHWLPFENLRAIKGVWQRFELSQTGEAGNAERLRLRSLAHAIEMWHENTGALSRLDIDPLPHQIHLVHHILASGNLNWMIADDVGLGKTIEVGMLLSALIRRGTHRRILLVVPSGLVNQWKEELHHKFALSDFQIYGEDFEIHDARHWKLYDFVIGSLDLLKSENHLPKLLQADNWDLIVFDEAHRLSRMQYGLKFQSSERFKLAAALRKHTDALLLLTATPHQGKNDKFQGLLELIRPSFKNHIRNLSLHPEILREMVIRNNKSDVTDAEGNFIFQGKTTSSIAVDQNEVERSFDRHLKKYLQEGYNSRGKGSEIRDRAIGFVMATYRKLAASSIASIERALRKRLERLKGDIAGDACSMVDIETVDERFVGEWEETDYGPRAEFFQGEIAVLKDLLRQAELVFNHDSKLSVLLNQMIPAIRGDNPKEKMVIFTEYRGTQDYLSRTLSERYGEQSVAVIHGGQDRSEREQAIIQFEDEGGQFLVSTEAGGEGINLQRQCHVMVNYDLPWNPMRLVQRVGRLYRYGQQNKVLVFNVSVSESMDGSILNILYNKIENVVADMSVLGGEFRPGFEAEILGELVEVLDVADIINKSDQEPIVRTQEKIDAALQAARQAVEKQRELMQYAAGYDPNEGAGELAIGLEHVQAFLEGAFTAFHIEILEKTHQGKVMRIKLPQEMAEEIGMHGLQMQVTADRSVAARRRDILMMDLDSTLLNYLLKKVKNYSFDGRVANLESLESDAVITAMLRWQNDQGVRMRQEFAAFLITNGSCTRNPKGFSEWLKHPATDGQPPVGQRETTQKHYKVAVNAMDSRLDEMSNMDLHPENRQLVTGGFVA